MRRDAVRMARNGRLVIPAELREALGMSEGGDFVVELDDGTLRLVPMTEVVRRVQEEARRYIPEGRSLVDELLDERRREAERE